MLAASEMEVPLAFRAPLFLRPQIRYINESHTPALLELGYFADAALDDSAFFGGLRERQLLVWAIVERIAGPDSAPAVRALLSGGYQAQSADAVLLRIPIARHNNIARHSLRAGRATAAARCASERAAMAQTGHRSADVVGRYVGEANLSNENAASLVDLCILVHAERRPRSTDR